MTSKPLKLTPAAAAIYDTICQKGSISAFEAVGVHRVFDCAGRIMEIRKALKAAGRFEEIQSVYKKDTTGRRYVRYTRVLLPAPATRPVHHGYAARNTFLARNRPV